MVELTQDDQALRFATQMFDLLDRASTTSTYKYAVLLAILDCCQKHVGRDGSAPDFVTTRQLAEAVVDLYWTQTKPFGPAGNILAQNSGSQAKIVSLIEAFRRRHGGVTSPHTARLLAATEFEKLVRDVEWTLVLMPLPKLQRLGGNSYEFLYTIGWDDHIRKRASGFSDYQRGKPSEFDNRILLKPGVGDFLVRLGPLLRPLIQREWARTVAGFNSLAIDALESFLFDQHRQNLSRLVEPLTHAQEGRCFYCDGRLGGGRDVDHFVPWSRAPNDELHNFVLTHSACNSSKSNHLADAQHLTRWLRRNNPETESGRRFAAETEGLPWHSAQDESLSVARAVYLSVPTGMLLWTSTSRFSEARQTDIRLALT